MAELSSAGKGRCCCAERENPAEASAPELDRSVEKVANVKKKPPHLDFESRLLLTQTLTSLRKQQQRGGRGVCSL